MPKAIHYKANSVIYFSGDVDARVFLLNTGNIALTSVDITTGYQVTEYIKKGEFFGVKSALGNYPREENAMVLTDSFVYAFTGKEFEAFAQTNARIILQMIKVFSRQLRVIHKQLATLLDSEEEADPEEGLFNVMSAFYKSRHYNAAAQVGERYKKNYPGGKYLPQVDQLMRSAAGAAATMQQATENFSPPAQMAEAPNTGGDLLLSFNMAEDLFKAEKYDEAYNQYHIVVEAGNSDEITEASYMGAGKCLYFQAEYVRCLQLLTGFISKNPKSLKIAEALMYLGLCYQRMDRPDKAAAFYDKAALLAPPPLVPKIKELQEECNAMLGS